MKVKRITKYFSMAILGAFLLLTSLSVGCGGNDEAGETTPGSVNGDTSVSGAGDAQTNNPSGGIAGSAAGISGKGDLSTSRISGGAGQATGGKGGGIVDNKAGSGGSKSGTQGNEAGSGGSKSGTQGNEAGSGGSKGGTQGNEAGSGGSKSGTQGNEAGSGGSSGAGGTTNAGVFAIIVKAAGYVTQGEPDTLSYATSSPYNTHVFADTLAKHLEALNVTAEVVTWVDCANMECVHVPNATSTASIVVFAGPTYLSQLPQEIRDLVPALQKISPPPKVTSVISIAGSTAQGAVDSFISSLDSAGFKTVTGVAFSALLGGLNDQKVDEELKTLAQSLLSAI